MRLFGGKDARGAKEISLREARHSSAWAALRPILQADEGLRVLDVGPTSPNNINLLTGMGHSVYMADFVSDAEVPGWTREDEAGEQIFRVSEFINSHAALNGRVFDIVLLWDAADYLPRNLVQALFARLHDMTAPGGRMLMFGHVKPAIGFHRYHLRTDDQVDQQQVNDMAVTKTYTNRELETLLHPYSTYRFFLAKDNLREVLVNR